MALHLSAPDEIRASWDDGKRELGVQIVAVHGGMLLVTRRARDRGGDVCPELVGADLPVFVQIGDLRSERFEDRAREKAVLQLVTLVRSLAASRRREDDRARAPEQIVLDEAVALGD